MLKAEASVRFSLSAQDGILPSGDFRYHRKEEYLNARKCYEHEERIRVDGRECATQAVSWRALALSDTALLHARGVGGFRPPSVAHSHL